MTPLIPLLAAASAIGGFVWYRKKHPSASSVAKLQSSVALKGPRGETVFKPELAESMVRMLASMTYSFPDPNDRTFVQIKAEPSGAPVARSMSAYGWAESMNKTQSVLAHVSLAISGGGDKFLRAVDPGAEARYANPEGAYAVLLYVGCLEKGLAPPGSPPAGSALGVPIPMDDKGRVQSEISDPTLAAGVLDLLANGVNPDEMERVAGEIEKDGMSYSGSLLRRRAAELRASQPMPAPTPAPITPAFVTPTPIAPPTPTPIAPPAPPPPAPSGVAIPMIVSTASDPLNLRDAPNGAVKGQLPKGSVFNVVKKDASGAWAYGTGAGGQTGWASTQFLTDASSSPASPAASPASAASGSPYIVATSSDPLNLRASPSTGAIVGQLPKGSVFMVDSVSSGWAHGTGASGQTGWASLQYLKAQAASAGAVLGRVVPLRRRA